MMVKHVSFPSIEQFRHVVKQVRDRASWNMAPLPKLSFNGSVKLHGTNAGIVKDPYTQEIWFQSREQIITPEKDNAGFARWGAEHPDSVNLIFNVVGAVFGFHKLQPGDLIAIYGEWCGKGVQNKVAISEIEKMFVVFGVRIVRGEESIWFSPEQLIDVADGYGREEGEEDRIFHIQKFKTWTVEIDFSVPELSQNLFVEITNEVEQCCPVGKSFGVEGVGEGVVWRCVTPWEVSGPVRDSDDPTVIHDVDVTRKIPTFDLIFKVKGAKHSDTKTKQTATVDVEKVNSINEFAANVVTDHRCEKMIEKMKVEGVVMEPQSTPIFLKMVGQDVVKEESDVIEASGLDHKEVMPVVNRLARQWFLSYVNKV